MIKGNYLIFSIALLAFILTLYACSRGDRLSIDESSLSTGDTLSTGTNLGDLREDIENYEKPDDVDGEVFDMLTERLLEEIASLSLEKGVSQQEPDSPPLYFEMVDDGGGDTIFSWRYFNPGDYNLDGEVTIADVAQVARYYLADTSDGVNDIVESFVDGDNNGEITIADVAEIARNYLYVYDVSIGIFVNEPDPTLNLGDWIASAEYENHGALPVSGLPEGAVDLVLNRTEEDESYGKISLGVPSSEVSELFGNLYFGVRDYSDEPNFISYTPFNIGESDPPVIEFVSPESGDAESIVTFDAVFSSGSFPFTYEWDFGGGAETNTSTKRRPTVILGDLGSYDASVTVTNEYGTDSYDWTLVVTSMPVIAGVLPVTGIVGRTVVFSSFVGGTPPFEYSWDFGGGATPNTSVGSNPLVTLSDVGEYDAGLTVTNEHGSDAFEFVLTVQEMPPPVIHDVSPREGMDRENVTFTADITAFPPLTYFWDFAGGATPNTSTEPSPTVKLNSSEGEFPARLTLVNPGGSDTFDFTLTVTFVPRPPVIISVSPGSGMSGANVQFSAEVDGTPFIKFNWDFGSAAFPSTITETNPVVELKDPGEYTCFLEAENLYGTDTYEFTVNVTFAPGQWESEIVEYGGEMKIGQWADLEYTLEGEPMIAYTAQTGLTSYILKTARKTDGVWVFDVVDDGGGGITGDYASLDISPDGIPFIAYMFSGSDPFSYDLRLASFDGESWGYELIKGDGAGDNTNGRWTDLSIGESGNMYISHIFWEGGVTPFISKIHAFDGLDWTESDVVVNAWTSSSIIDADENPIVATHPVDPEFKIRWFNGSTWDVYDLQPAQNVSDWDVSMALAPDGNPGISWFVKGDGVSIDKDLMYAKWNGSEWEVATARGAGDAGYYSSLAYSPGGTPYISYHYLNNKSLKVARFKSGFWTSDTVDDGEGGLYDVGRYTSIAFNAEGKPTIAYYQWERDEYALKFAWQH